MNWKEWKYADWNLALLRHVFRSTSKWQRDPVERIQATPDELLVLVNDREANAPAVVEAFLANARANVPPRGKTFGSYCYDYKGWSTASREPPHFFGMLWLTCLAAHGYPNQRLPFHKRMWELLGKIDNLQRELGGGNPICLPPLWNDLQAWLAAANGRGEPYRTLLLPMEVGKRKGIGQSWFLTFPHAEDRSKLARALWEEGLVGFEPPVHKVLRLLAARKREFSKPFNEDLKDFEDAFSQGSVTAKSSAFWRAVRQESLSPCVEQNETRRRHLAPVQLIVADTQDGFQPLVCGVEGWNLPNGYTSSALPEPVGDLTVYLRGHDGALDEPVEDAFVYGNLLGLSHRKLVDQGVLLLREQSSASFAVVSGSEAHGVNVALVRNDLLEPFLRAFGGEQADVLLDGWTAVTECAVRVEESLPQGLERVLQLLPTMFPRVVSASDGIRIDAGFLRALHFLPHLHADGASTVVIEDGGGQEIPCAKVDHEGRVEWELPAASIPRNGKVLARAVWKGAASESLDVAETWLNFREESNAVEFKPPPLGGYDIEACTQPEMLIRGGEPVGLGITTYDACLSADLFHLETQVRYLGPGIGQMSREPQPTFDWLALGTFKNPEALVFMGNPNSPCMPEQARADSAGARRHWREAFSNAKVVLVRTPEGNFDSVGKHPHVEMALGAYRRHQRVAADAATCPTMELSALEERPDGLVAADEATDEAVSALAALSARRAGLGYKEVASILGGLLPRREQGHEDFLAVQQLVRAWTECGQIDVLREVSGGHLVIATRRPRLVLVRRGPGVEGRVIGLLNPSVRRRIEQIASRFRVSLSELEAPNRWQPSIVRLRGTEKALSEVAREAEFEPSEWLHWPSLSKVPEHFDVTTAYRHLRPDLATNAFKTHFAWDWERLVFSKAAVGKAGRAGVVVHRRLHPDGSAVHVVLDKGLPVASSYTRNWALLFAYDMAGVRPFARADGALVCRGASPVHLPLPIARLCAFTGAGLPGPRFEEKSGKVRSYEYPLGKGLLGLLQSVIPGSWIAR
ncbi:hypothetical protein [Anaeromyxobacter oryzisoli]|uniref:hypothetical protein n=1 Tax=Anaeromyxobacter oryzisoli TaxID=2925408 RepID=UPI001F58337F|nr:hypothetical protein [Anaeromyxobacter sp. SG63]